MKVSRTAKQTAILDIFKDQQIIRENGRLPLSLLQEEWARSGLRRADLAEGLSALIESGLMASDPIDLEPGVKLTAAGSAFITRLNLNPLDLADQARDLMVLNRARKRRPAAARTSDTRNA